MENFVIENGILKRYTGNETKAIIPDGVTEIGDGAFSWHSSLKEITIPIGVTEIGDRAFNWCSSLKEITIPDSVTEIGIWAFNGCESLKKIYAPKGLHLTYAGVPEDCEIIER